MKKYSGGYSNLNPNFIISNIKNSKIDDDYFGILCVAKNILFRGCPTNASVYINAKYPINYQKNTYQYCFDTEYQNFDRIIKTGLDNNKQALVFYKELCKKTTNPFMSFLPECSRNSIIYDEKIPKESAVDFYSPFLKTVIEIDGSQHEEDKAKEEDLNRDLDFRNNNVNVIRIKTKEINNLHYIKELDNYINDWNANIDKTNVSNEVKDKNEINSNDAILCFIFRLQILLLELFKANQLMFSDDNINIEVSSDYDINVEICSDAYNDLKELLKNLFVLDNKELVFPNINFKITKQFSNDRNLKCIIDIFNLYDQSAIIDSDIIYVQNDYFFYPLKDMNDGLNNYPTYKNYYEVEISDFRFKNISIDNNSHIKSLEYLLKLIFKYDTFRPKQLDIIINGLKPSVGVIGLLPTSSGKSLCYQMVSLLTPGITIVISPLNVLMEDQCKDLNSIEISRAYFINSSESNPNNKNTEIYVNTNQKKELKREKTLRLFKDNQTKILYISPERFFNGDFLKSIKDNSSKISQIAIDEVHCLSEWGHDFRTSYLLLFNFIKNLSISKNILLMGTSATASPRVTDDICTEFKKIKDRITLVKATSILRPELTFVVEKISEENKLQRVQEIINNDNNQDKKDIVFCAYINTVNSLKASLKENNANLEIAAFSSENTNNKSQILDDFKNDTLKCVVATKAFGMGVNIPNIRRTIHYDFSASVESIYQEMGRAGRDGKESICTVLYDDSKENNINELFNKERITINDIKSKYGYYGGLDKQFFLISKSTLDPNKEASFIIRLLHYLTSDDYKKNSFNLQDSTLLKYLNSAKLDDWFKKNNSNIINRDKFKQQIDKALYKLYLLDLINLWSIDYANNLDNPIYFVNVIHNITASNADNRFALEALCNYIRKYDYKYNPENNNHNINFSDRKHLVSNCVTELCEWSFDHFFMNRWLSLKNLHDIVCNYRSSEEFARRIDSYLVENELLNDAIKMARENKNNFQNWFKLILSENPNILKDKLSRILENEGDDNLAANFISSIVQLKLDQFNTRDGVTRCNLAFEEIIGMNSNDIKEILDGTYSILNENEKIIFDTFLIEFLIKKSFVDKSKEFLSSEEYESLMLYESLYKLSNAIDGGI